MRDIIYHMRWVPSAVVFSPTEVANGDWGGHFPSSFIYPGYEPEACRRLIVHQRKEARRAKKDPSYKIKPTMVVLEDCMFDKRKFVTDPSARGLMMNGRQWGILLLMSVQYVMDITRDMRTQFDYIFIFKDNDIGNRERLWKNWGGVVPTLEAFSSIMQQCTRDHGCLVIDQTSLSDRIEDCLFWYRAEERDRTFKVGNRTYWLYHFANTRHQGGDVDSDDEDELIFHKRGQKPGQRVRVRRLE